MRFSIVIPTYNRSEKLTECLQALFAQKYNKKLFEIIVVDDGSQDDTLAMLEKLQKKSPVAFSVFSQKNQGQGVARNTGIAHAKGEIVVLIGDDIIATPHFLQKHDRAHCAHPEENAGVLGFITWHDRLKVTPLMRFMEKGGVILGRFGGHQFAFDLLEGRETADYHFFYTSNISLKRTLLVRYKFDPWFAGYGWEDIELGYRLTREVGLRLYYQPGAIAYHDHMMSTEDFTRRMYSIGSSSHLFHKKYPELNILPSPRKQKILRFISHPLSLRCLRLINRNLYFYALSKKYFLRGVEEGYNKRN